MQQKLSGRLSWSSKPAVLTFAVFSVEWFSEDWFPLSWSSLVAHLSAPFEAAVWRWGGKTVRQRPQKHYLLSLSLALPARSRMLTWPSNFSLLARPKTAWSRFQGALGKLSALRLLLCRWDSRESLTMTTWMREHKSGSEICGSWDVGARTHGASSGRLTKVE